MADQQMINIARKIEITATVLAQAIADAEELAAVYMAREMYTGGKKEIKDSDLLTNKSDPTSQAVVVTAADVVSFVNFVGDLKKFMAGEVIKTPQAWMPTLNRIRTDM